MCCSPHRTICGSCTQNDLTDWYCLALITRGEATSDSDVDVLIVLYDPVDLSQKVEQLSYFLSHLCLDHNLLIAPLLMAKSRISCYHYQQ